MTTRAQQKDQAGTIGLVDRMLKADNLPSYTELRMKYNADTVALKFEAELFIGYYREALSVLGEIINNPDQAKQLAQAFMDMKAYGSKAPEAMPVAEEV